MGGAWIQTASEPNVTLTGLVSPRTILTQELSTDRLSLAQRHPSHPCTNPSLTQITPSSLESFWDTEGSLHKLGFRTEHDATINNNTGTERKYTGKVAPNGRWREQDAVSPRQ